MVKRIIKETTREYDTDGRLLKETVIETSEDDDTAYSPLYPYNPNMSPVIYDIRTTCDTTAHGNN